MSLVFFDQRPKSRGRQLFRHAEAATTAGTDKSVLCVSSV